MHLSGINPRTYFQGRLLPEPRKDEGHGHGEADKEGGHDDLAQEALPVPLAVVEPLDLQGGYVL